MTLLLTVAAVLGRWAENYEQLVKAQHDWDPDSVFGKVWPMGSVEELPNIGRLIFDF